MGSPQLTSHAMAQSAAFQNLQTVEQAETALMVEQEETAETVNLQNARVSQLLQTIQQLTVSLVKTVLGLVTRVKTARLVCVSKINTTTTTIRRRCVLMAQTAINTKFLFSCFTHIFPGVSNIHHDNYHDGEPLKGY